MRRAVSTLVLVAMAACSSPSEPADTGSTSDTLSVVLKEPLLHISPTRGAEAPYDGEQITPGSYWLRVETDKRDFKGRGKARGWKHRGGVDSVVIVVDGKRTRELWPPYEARVADWEAGEHTVEWSVYGAGAASETVLVPVGDDRTQPDSTSDDPPAGEPPADEPPADAPPADEPPADEPPADEPPAEDPPAEDPPAEDPPTEAPPSNEIPSASFDASCTELTCTFDGRASSDQDGSLVDYDWALGDGTHASGASIEHEYDSEGTFEVVLTVTDDDGASDSASDDVTVDAPDAPPSGDLQPNGPSGNWDLALGEEFDGSSLDGSTWTPHYAWHPTDINGELQYFDPDRPYVSGGTLKLRADRTAQNGKSYTSGAVSSHGKFSFRYGVAEMRAKLPAGKGLWPAFWTMPEGGGWPPEIDIMENIGDPNRVHFNLHHSGGNMGAPSFSGLDTRQWHTYTVHWRSDRIDWYVDGTLRASYTNAGNIPQQSMYLLLNLAVGGSWPGSPDGSTPFPATYEIDYVRVWQ